MIRVALADDQALVRSGFRALLGLFEGLQVVAEAEDGEAAIRVVMDTNPDVLLLDVRMPRRNGVEVVTELAARRRLPPTLLLTTFEDDFAMVACVRAGARGYLLKGVTPEVLVEAIRTLAAGGSYLYAPVTSQPASNDQNAARQASLAPGAEQLTERERDVLQLLSSGISNKEIASALRLSEGTVRNHVSSIFAKLGVNDRTKAVLCALQRGLV
jgi:DNA-binding NarL/FixJ family response regulator